MPDETEYEVVFQGKWIHASIAKPEFVILSEALKAPERNKNLIADYVASGPPERFFKLVEMYQINLSKMLD